MTLHTLAAGSLITDPVRRSGAKGDFAIATIRVATEDGAILISLIGFGETAERLLGHQVGHAIAVSGRTKLSSWTVRHGAEHHGLSIVVEDIASAASARRSDAERRRNTKTAA